MAERISSLVWKAALAVLALLLLTGEASAYAGPVPGPEFFGYFMSLVAWLGIAFSSLLLWPLHALRQRFRRRGAAAPAAESPVPAGVGAAEEVRAES